MNEVQIVNQINLQVKIKLGLRFTIGVMCTAFKNMATTAKIFIKQFQLWNCFFVISVSVTFNGFPINVSIKLTKIYDHNFPFPLYLMPAFSSLCSCVCGSKQVSMGVEEGGWRSMRFTHMTDWWRAPSAKIVSPPPSEDAAAFSMWAARCGCW